MNTATLLHDEELWAGVINDDTRAFAALYNRHWKKLYKTTLYYLKDQATAEEILHNVFVTLWNRRHYLKIENFSNYVYVATRYHIYKQLKAAKISPVEYIDDCAEHIVPVDFNEAVARLNYHDISSELATNLAPLPKRCREIFWLSRVENRTNEEIAKLFGISKRTVENQITHALKHLRLSCRELFELILFVFAISRL